MSDILFALGRDERLGPVRRWMARVISDHERVPLRVLLRPEPLRQLVRAPTSGWGGNLLVAGTWSIAVVAAAALLPR